MKRINCKTPVELKKQQLSSRRGYRILLLVVILFSTEGYAHNTLENLLTSSNSYYIDAVGGNDNNNGSINNPWRSLNKVSATTFLPGDNIYFKRGTSYTGSVTINGNGTQGMPITVGAYGTGAAPKLTNPNYGVNKGNAMRVRGDFQIIENLYFHHTAPAPSHASSFEEVWEIGALHISMGNDHVIIRNNEFANIPKAIQSYSQNSLITANYIHDANMDQENGFLQNPYWGPIGIQLGIGNQEVSHNRIENMYAVGGEFIADGGAIEIDDGRNHKDNIKIHHNETYHNMGFLEVSYWDDITFRESNNMVVEYNLSRDYQSFLLWWAPTHNSIVKNNTIIRDDNEVEGNWNAVFILDAPPGDINLTKNIVVVDNDQTESIFIQGYDGAVNDVSHTDNCYWNVDGGSINLGLTKQSTEIITDPLFISYTDKNYFLQTGSPATDWGAFGVMEMAGNACTKENLILSGEITSSQIHETDGRIESTQNISNSSSVIYDSSSSITLKPDFSVSSGATLHAFIDGCDKSITVEENTPIRNRQIQDTPVPSQPSQIATLAVSPNPFHNTTYINYEITVAGYSTVMVVNALGQIMQQPLSNTWQESGKYTFTIDSHLFPKGIYYVILKSNKQVCNRKIIKN